MARILPAHYFQAVFTLPSELRPVAQRNPRRVYTMFFAAVSETLLELGEDPKWLGAQLGITAVLHTWNAEIGFHPHIHCIVTGGGLCSGGPEGPRWLECHPKFLFPVDVMSALFRDKMLAKLRHAHARGKLKLGPEPVDPEAFPRLLGRVYQREWLTYAKRPFGGPEQVIRYLGCYVHRIAISNHRLVSLQDGKVTFRSKSGKCITLPAERFLARFLRHVLPHGFAKIRHYGLLAPSNATTRLELARTLLTSSQAKTPNPAASACSLGAPVSTTTSWPQLLLDLTGVDIRRCRACGALAVVRRALPSDARAPPEAA